MEKKTLGTFLSALRRAKGMTQRELAEKLNVSDKAVSRWERDESAPDLTLIPVIAEIFDVTSDELLRGARRSDSDSPERTALRTEKQLQRLLKDTKTKFYIRCSISVAIALLGLIAAVIGNTGFLRALIGFLSGCVFFVIALLCQVIFLIQGLSALDNEDFDQSRPAKSHLIRGSQLIIGIILALSAFCLPLAIFVPDTHMGLQTSSWIPLGLLFAAAAGLLMLPAIYLINIKLGIRPKPDFKTPLGRLRTRCIKISTVIVLCLAVGHISLAGFLSDNPHVVTDHLRFDTLEAFKKHIETPTTYDGKDLSILDVTSSGGKITYVYQDETGVVYEYPKESVMRELYAHIDDTKPLLTFRWLNNAATYINYGSASKNLLPIYVLSSTQVRRANNICELICAGYCITYIGVLLAMGSYYRKKKKLL